LLVHATSMDPPTMGESSSVRDDVAGIANGRIVDLCPHLAAALIASVPSFGKPAAATAGTPGPPPARSSQPIVGDDPLRLRGAFGGQPGSP
jgi:hypothetical protein